MLLKRFKNRLKAVDEVVKSVQKEKANRDDFHKLEKAVAMGRPEEMFNDMKILYDSTVATFDKKVVDERNKVAKTYQRIVEQQRSMMIGFEMKYNNLIRGRLDKIEAFTEDLALEQAKLNTKSAV